ncbi:MAG: hypothetical protein OZSIB_2852 [Candidatus Ozemobacter sibiricus]|uniref:Uncharacterized protein n=1 Tax=Candidatus Ozemobacter sibiricus TaxID=2268124 RepID=A0A367ZI74_9BACT|nr:MAG: hypothetical protein OZSIB_2852 [Candidatus Ozemobacter sibiricus]
MTEAPTNVEARALREAILQAPLETSQDPLAIPSPETLYLPPSHGKVLNLDAQVVIGGRGTGKSFWTAALQSDLIRHRLGTTVHDLASLSVHIGFSSAARFNDYPNADVFAACFDQRREPFDLWRAVIVRWIAAKEGEAIPRSSWQDTIDWMKARPEEVARVMERPRHWRGLILFDALDRTTTVWERMDTIVRDLLRAVLWLKGFAGLYAKVFLREDQAERQVFNFPDASKLVPTKVELSWARHDLHGLLWQRLINAQNEYGERLRAICPHRSRGQYWEVDEEMKRESPAQRQAFERLAGPWMGRDRRRGVPYTWAISHLADGKGRTSPRSFLAAIRQAAEDSRDRYPQHEFALHFESIKRGIQKASEIRVAEIAEDYPWATALLSLLRGMNVPCEWREVEARWAAQFPEGPDHIHVTAPQLPPPHARQGWEGVRDDLLRLGLLDRKKDGRLDMPDLYRVGFGLGRKGGVKPRA